MPLIQADVNEEVLTLTQMTEINGTLTDAIVPIEEEDMYTAVWVDNEEVLNDEREIGGLAMTTEAIRALIAGE